MIRQLLILPTIAVGKHILLDSTNIKVLFPTLREDSKSEWLYLIGKYCVEYLGGWKNIWENFFHVNFNMEFTYKCSNITAIYRMKNRFNKQKWRTSCKCRNIFFRKPKIWHGVCQHLQILLAIHPFNIDTSVQFISNLLPLGIIYKNPIV